jgi:hypothetical protein
VAFLQPPFPSEQVIYFKAASAFPNIEPEHWQLRIGLLLPVRVLIEGFGYSELAYYAVPVAAGALTASATYYLGALLFGRWVGLFAAVLTTVNSFVLLKSSTLLPDVLATGLFTLALGLVIAAGRRWESGNHEYGQMTLLVSAGLLLGWSYLCREFIVVAFVVIGIALYQARMPLRSWLTVAGSAALVFLGETVLNTFVHGQPLVRLSVAAGHGQGYVDPAVARTFQDQPPAVILGRLPEALLERPDGVWVLLLLSLLLLGAAFSRQRSLVLLALWVLSFWISLTLVGGLVDPSSPSLRLQKIRYWFPIFPTMFLGGLAVLSVVIVRYERQGRLRSLRDRLLRPAVLAALSWHAWA